MANNKKNLRLNSVSAGTEALFHVIVGLFSVCCIIPFAFVIIISFSAEESIREIGYSFTPNAWSTAAYTYAFNKLPQIWRSYFNSIFITVVGTVLSTLMCAMYSYALYRPDFKYRGFFNFLSFFTMIFGGGLVPTYMTIRYLGQLDTIWVLVLPGAVPVFNVVLMMNFFRSIPKEIEEAAFIDGAGHFKTLVKIYLPLSLPSLATVSLFVVVNHWNSWFDGIIYMNHTYNYPLQSYLRTIIINPDLQSMTSSEELVMSEISERTFKAAQIFLGALPILCVYPFLQKYFMSGLTMGSVKG
jgi:putative aldouronate transport system permease protein